MRVEGEAHHCSPGEHSLILCTDSFACAQGLTLQLKLLRVTQGEPRGRSVTLARPLGPAEAPEPPFFPPPAPKDPVPAQEPLSLSAVLLEKALLLSLFNYFPGFLDSFAPSLCRFHTHFTALTSDSSWSL